MFFRIRQNRVKDNNVCKIFYLIVKSDHERDDID